MELHTITNEVTLEDYLNSGTRGSEPVYKSRKVRIVSRTRFELQPNGFYKKIVEHPMKIIIIPK
jgi:hypothetical protein